MGNFTNFHKILAGKNLASAKYDPHFEIIQNLVSRGTAQLTYEATSKVVRILHED